MTNKKKFVYICSKVRANTWVERNRNIEFARQRAVEVYKKGYIPICVQVYLEQVTELVEDNGDREELLKLGREFVKICDEVWVYGKESEGMKGEIEYAKRLKKIVKWI